MRVEGETEGKRVTKAEKNDRNREKDSIMVRLPNPLSESSI